ncbi:hypothetical protein PPE_05055 [Paenibacillus polymyxa E681]|nr:hypothetical protein PPE_05055 [Paenibacillus polymyxa E681]
MASKQGCPAGATRSTSYIMPVKLQPVRPQKSLRNKILSAPFFDFRVFINRRIPFLIHKEYKKIRLFKESG